MTFYFCSGNTGSQRTPAAVATAVEEDWPALPSPARPPIARVVASNTPPVYHSPFPAPDPAPKGRGRDAGRRGSGGRGGRGRGRESGSALAEPGVLQASAGPSLPPTLQGVPVQMEGLGPDAPALPVTMGEPSRGTSLFVNICMFSPAVPLKLDVTGRGGHSGRGAARPASSSSPRPAAAADATDSAPAPRPSRGGRGGSGPAPANPSSAVDAAPSPRPARGGRGRGGL